MPRMWVCTLFILVLWANPSVSIDQCHAQSCSSCLANPSCGWCSSFSKCSHGSSAAPTNITSCPNPSDWKWDNCSPRADCAAFSSCVSCHGNRDCGWSETESACFYGKKQGVCPSDLSTASVVSMSSSISGSFIIIEYSSNIDVVRPDVCSASHTCTFSTDTQLLVYLNADDIGPASVSLAPLSGPLQPSDIPFAPVVTVEGPSIVRSDSSSPVVLDVSASLGAFGSVVDYAWSVDPAIPALQGALDGALSSLEIPSDLLAAGADYVFSVSLTLNWNGVMSVSAQHSLTRLAPTSRNVQVEILGPSTVYVDPHDDVVLTALVSPPSDTGSFEYAWTKIAGPHVELDERTQVTNSYTIPRGTFTGPHVFIFECSVTLENELATIGRDSVAIVVSASGSIFKSLPQMQIATRLKKLLINASQVGTEFQWDCFHSLYPNDCPLPTSLLPSNGVIDIPTSVLAPGLWTFPFVATSGTKQQRSRAVVMVSWDDSPTGSIDVWDPQSHHQAPMVNTNYNLVLFANIEPFSTNEELEFLWSLSPPVQSQHSNSSSVFVIDTQTLSQATTYTVELRLTSENSESVLSYTFHTNEAPRSYEAPTAGADSLDCGRWDDDQLHYPLSYQLIHAASSFSVVTAAQISCTIPVWESGDYVLRVFDAMGSYTDVDVNVPTVSGEVIAKSNVLDLVQQSISNGTVQRIDLMIYNSFALLDDISAQQWLNLIDLYDKYVVIFPSASSSLNTALTLRAASEHAHLMTSPSIFRLILDHCVNSWERVTPMFHPDSWLSVLDNVIPFVASSPENAPRFLATLESLSDKLGVIPVPGHSASWCGHDQTISLCVRSASPAWFSPPTTLSVDANHSVFVNSPARLSAAVVRSHIFNDTDTREPISPIILVAIDDSERIQVTFSGMIGTCALKNGASSQCVTTHLMDEDTLCDCAHYLNKTSIIFLTVAQPGTRVEAWVPIVVILVLLLLLLLLILLAWYLRERNRTPPAETALAKVVEEPVVGPSSSLDEHSVHLHRPVQDGTDIPHNQYIVYYEEDSSGADVVPQDAEPVELNVPIKQRYQRKPFVGGNVQLQQYEKPPMVAGDPVLKIEGEPEPEQSESSDFSSDEQLDVADFL